MIVAPPPPLAIRMSANRLLRLKFGGLEALLTVAAPPLVHSVVVAFSDSTYYRGHSGIFRNCCRVLTASPPMGSDPRLQNRQNCGQFTPALTPLSAEVTDFAWPHNTWRHIVGDVEFSHCSSRFVRKCVYSFTQFNPDLIGGHRRFAGRNQPRIAPVSNIRCAAGTWVPCKLRAYQNSFNASWIRRGARVAEMRPKFPPAPESPLGCRNCA